MWWRIRDTCFRLWLLFGRLPDDNSRGRFWLLNINYVVNFIFLLSKEAKESSLSSPFRWRTWNLWFSDNGFIYLGPVFRFVEGSFKCFWEINIYINLLLYVTDIYFLRDRSVCFRSRIVCMVLWKSHKVSFVLLLTDSIRNQRILVNNLRLYPTSEIVALCEVRLEVIDGLMIDKFILIQIS